MAVFPITGHIMFLLWGNRRSKRPERRILAKLNRGAKYLEYDSDVMDVFTKKYPTKSRMARYLETNKFPLYKNKQNRLLSHGRGHILVYSKKLLERKNLF